MTDSASPTALVTGAATGLGLAIARRLARRGDAVVLADIDGTRLAEAVGAITAEGGAARALRLDVSDAQAVADEVAAIDHATPLTSVVNNAGLAFGAPLLDTAVERWDRLFSVNVRGTFVVTQAAARAMVPRGAGAIVNICSTSSFTASTGPMAAYDASKGAVAMLTRAVARELAPKGIRVNGVAPGTMDTALVRGLGSSDDDLAALATARVPLGRLGRTDEIADAVAWLTGPESSYVVGSIVAVDGGWLA